MMKGIYFLIFVGLFSVLWASKIDDLISQEISPTFCTRIFSEEGGTVGCFNKKHGERGYLIHLETEQDLFDFAEQDEDIKRIVILDPSFLKYLDRFGEATFVHGVIIPYSKTHPTEYSPASKIIRGSHSWNPNGLEFTETEFPFPVLFANEEETKLLLERAKENSDIGFGHFPQTAMKTDYYMGPKLMTSIKCLEMGKCLPLGGQSLVGSLFQEVLTTPKPVIGVVTNLDARAVIHDLSYGGNEAISSVLSIVSAIEALKKLPQSTLDGMTHDIAFAFFNGEKWDQIGSRKFVEDAETFECLEYLEADKSATGYRACIKPVMPYLGFQKWKTSNIDALISVDQVGKPVVDDTTGEINLRTFVTSAAESVALAEKLEQESASVTDIKVSRTSLEAGNIPPSPIEAFVAEKSDIPAVILAGYDSTFNDPLYGSMFDTPQSINTKAVALTGSVLARTVCKLAGGVEADCNALAADESTVTGFVNCLNTENSDCTFFKDKKIMDSNLSKPLSMYVSVYRAAWRAGSTGFGMSTTLWSSLLAEFLNDVINTPDSPTACTSAKDCDTGMVCVAEKCMKSTIEYQRAVSPRIESDTSSDNDATWKIKKEETGDYKDGVWTEPFWSNDVGSKIYKGGIPWQEHGAKMAAIAVMIFFIHCIRHFVHEEDKKILIHN
eukprot:TRINITY_DN13856_c0_g1_i1.p1 TRINITY_DN13856_c0_g1~~TRINITY_DN13856_c0_g1_i1.p1  ORF type:complete len:667 (-),score=193.37 TRINITY_DN13856_c0_g1_i1:238-2238(-)